MTAQRKLDAAGLELLTQACSLADELERLHGRLAVEDMVVEGSTGQPRANPLLDEIRRHVDALARTLKALHPHVVAEPVDDPWDAIARELTGAT